MSLLRKAISTSIFSFFLFFIALPFFTMPAQAVTLFPSFPADQQPKGPSDYLNEFCKKRSGELMNLETWYSGKCDPEETDTFSGEGVGFSDIVVLQLFEYAMGEQKDDFLTMIGKFIKSLEEAAKIDLSGTKNSNITAYETQKIFSEYNKGLLGNLGTITTYIVESKPATTNGYVNYIASNLKSKQVISDTYAATNVPGFTALEPILPIWKAFRNLAYMLFAILFIAYGVMIMFRVRIDSKTAATIQLAIPKLVTTLLLITFSYAIVGLMIDISTVLTAISVNILRLPGGILTESQFGIVNLANGNSPLGAVGSWLINSLATLIVAPFAIFNLLIGGSLSAILGSIFSVLTLAVFGLFGVILVFLAVLFAFFKLIVKLFQAYFSVIIYLIFSPIILLGNALPGSTAFQTWMKNIVGNLIVFPATVFLLTLSFALMVQPLLNLGSVIGGAIDSTSGSSIEEPLNELLSKELEPLLGVKNLSTFNNLWTPPFTIGAGIGGENVASNGSLMLAAIGIGLLLMSSKYVDMIHEAMKVSPFKYGSALVEPLKEGFSTYGSSDYGKKNRGYRTMGYLTGWNKPSANTTTNTGGPNTSPSTPNISGPTSGTNP